MKEFAPPAFETQEARHSPEHHEVQALPTAEQAEPLRKGEADPSKTLQEVRKAVSETAESDTRQEALKHLQEAENAPQMATPSTIDSQLRGITLRRELKGLQRKLSPPQRMLSKVVHQPVVRAVSEATGKTVSRPSGVLGGGLVALVGTSTYLYLAKHLGFEYNYFVFLVLFAGGFALGLLLEFLVWVTLGHRKKSQS